MGQICIGLCEHLKTAPMKNQLRYRSGQKRCSLCAHYFDTKDPRCPCCKTRLRSKARSRKTKLKNLEWSAEIDRNEKLLSVDLKNQVH